MMQITKKFFEDECEKYKIKIIHDITQTNLVKEYPCLQANMEYGFIGLYIPPDFYADSSMKKGFLFINNKLPYYAKLAVLYHEGQHFTCDINGCSCVDKWKKGYNYDLTEKHAFLNSLKKSIKLKAYKTIGFILHNLLLNEIKYAAYLKNKKIFLQEDAYYINIYARVSRSIRQNKIYSEAVQLLKDESPSMLNFIYDSMQKSKTVNDVLKKIKNIDKKRVK